MVFDIGNVLITFAPEKFIVDLFPGDVQKQEEMLKHVFQGKYWPEFDRGTCSYEEAAQKLSEEFGGDPAEYLHAITGWIELKTPIEAGFQAAARCRRAGKRLWLLSNYHEPAYLRLREKFADRFSVFDGGTISCFHHINKPERGIYEALIREAQLVPERTLYLDDTLVNVEAAMEFGIHGFHVTGPEAVNRFFI